MCPPADVNGSDRLGDVNGSDRFGVVDDTHHVVDVPRRGEQFGDECLVHSPRHGHHAVLHGDFDGARVQQVPADKGLDLGEDLGVVADQGPQQIVLTTTPTSRP